MLSRISSWISAHLVLLVIGVTALSLAMPRSFSGIPISAISPMLGIVIFGMGLTLKPSDFRPIFIHPYEVIIGVLAQYIVMPALAWLLCLLFGLPSGLALGVILVGCCPGGSASNVICYLAKGDIALSVAMTGVSTLLSPFVTPALIWLLAGENINFDAINMFMSIIQIVILPLLIGFIFSRYFNRTTHKLLPLLPTVSAIVITLIIGIVVSHNARSILACSMVIAGVVVLHNLLGYVCGYAAAGILGLDYAKRTAISVEVGMQNSGLATSLATTFFAIYPIAAVPGALFSVWHNISGTIAARLFVKLSFHRSVKATEGELSSAREGYSTFEESTD